MLLHKIHFFKKYFCISHFYTKWIALLLVSLVSTPTITADGWVTPGSLQISCPPFQQSCCSHLDLSGQPVSGTYLGCFCHTMILMTHGSYLWWNLRWQSILVCVLLFPGTKEKNTSLPPTHFFFPDYYEVRRCRKGSQEKERKFFRLFSGQESSVRTAAYLCP